MSSISLLATCFFNYFPRLLTRRTKNVPWKFCRFDQVDSFCLDSWICIQPTKVYKCRYTLVCCFHPETVTSLGCLGSFKGPGIPTFKPSLFGWGSIPNLQRDINRPSMVQLGKDLKTWRLQIQFHVLVLLIFVFDSIVEQILFCLIPLGICAFRKCNLR